MTQPRQTVTYCMLNTAIYINRFEIVYFFITTILTNTGFVVIYKILIFITESQSYSTPVKINHIINHWTIDYKLYSRLDMVYFYVHLNVNLMQPDIAPQFTVLSLTETQYILKQVQFDEWKKIPRDQNWTNLGSLLEFT